jgi:bleomycin hydrolase
MRNRLIIGLVVIFLTGFPVFASVPDNGKRQNESKSGFTLTSTIHVTSVKDQNRTSTCWSFATVSFLESELIKRDNKFYDLSEMFIVRKIYIEKAERYIRMHGNMNFAGGGEPNDVVFAIQKYGIVPESVYTGLLVDSIFHDHAALDKELKELVDKVIKDQDAKLSGNWQKQFESILDKHLGKVPPSFIFEGIQYTARSFADSLKLNYDNYILISSFSHHPFNSSFILEVPDNWSWGEVYNVPVEEMVKITDFIISQGTSVVWSTDYSEIGFDYNAGMAVAPKILYEIGNKKEKQFFDLNNPIEELDVTQQNRQEAFDNYSTTDDHGMHIIGLANGSDGKQYYYVKNSWGSDNIYNGYLYVSKAYFQYKTISIMVDKTTLPIEIRQKLNL